MPTHAQESQGLSGKVFRLAILGTRGNPTYLHGLAFSSVFIHRTKHALGVASIMKVINRTLTPAKTLCGIGKTASC